MAAAFSTPPNEKSFSALIDQAVTEVGQAARFRTAVQYANLTIRECQTFGLFARDRLEEVYTADASPFIWTRPRYFRSIYAARYLGHQIDVKCKQPGSPQRDERFFFYAADDYYVFRGCAEGEQVALINYYWLKPLLYFGRLGSTTTGYPGGPYTTRTAFYDMLEDTWMYLNVSGDAYVTTLNDPDAEEIARKNSYHWMLESFYELILEGTKNKLFNIAGDPRAQPTYASYKAAQKLFINANAFEAEVGALV